MGDRREFLKIVASTMGAGVFTGLAGCAGTSSIHTQVQADIVIIGGGFAGATCARQLRQLLPYSSITLIEKSPVYTACPMSNMVVTGHRKLNQQQFTYASFAALNINVVHDEVVDINFDTKYVRMRHHSNINYDVAVISPGVDLRFSSVEGYSQKATELLPHAWKAGAQTVLLQKQLASMKDGGVFVITVPGGPYRCPPGPYERASLVGHYFKQFKPKSKVLILDRKDTFSKMPLFQHAWETELKGYVEWQGASMGSAVVGVDTKSRQVFTDFDSVSADVINVIPEQQAGSIARDVGLTDRSGWCPITPSTFESTLVNDVYVIGDAAIANAMPKSAFSANAQAKLCALQIARKLVELPAVDSKLINTCYSLITPEYGISVADVFYPEQDLWRQVAGAGGVSSSNASLLDRSNEARYAFNWYDTITREVFG